MAALQLHWQQNAGRVNPACDVRVHSVPVGVYWSHHVSELEVARQQQQHNDSTFSDILPDVVAGSRWLPSDCDTGVFAHLGLQTLTHSAQQNLGWWSRAQDCEQCMVSLSGD